MGNIPEVLSMRLRKLAIRANLPVLSMIDGELVDAVPDWSMGDYIAYEYTDSGKLHLIIRYLIDDQEYTLSESEAMIALDFLILGASMGRYGEMLHSGEMSRKARLERGETLEPIVYAKA